MTCTTFPLLIFESSVLFRDANRQRRRNAKTARTALNQ
jgi:hypothetical protein